MDFEFSIARRKDAEAIGDLVASTSREFISPGLSEAGARTMAFIAQPWEIRNRVARGYRFHLAKTTDGALAGIAATRDNCHLYMLFVEGRWHGQGLGAQLWTTARRACERAGHSGPFTVNASEYALGFYRRMGFVGSSRVEQDNIVFWPMTLDPIDLRNGRPALPRKRRRRNKKGRRPAPLKRDGGA